jgi:hypothetical protein
MKVIKLYVNILIVYVCITGEEKEILINVQVNMFQIIWYDIRGNSYDTRGNSYDTRGNSYDTRLLIYLLFYAPLKNISLIWSRHYCR